MKMLKKLFFLLIVTHLPFFLAACNKEKNKETVSEKEGVGYYQKGEYKKALPLLQKSADSGNATAFYYLGLMQREGKGIEKNDGKSCESFLKAAEGGYQDAYLLAGICYRVGDGFKRDDREAFKWAQKAAAVGESQMNNEDRLVLSLFMADRYFAGEGTLQDFSEAAKWYEKAAVLGDARAQGVMAFFYYSGKGRLINKEKAKYWAEKAAAQDNDMGEFALGMLNHFNDPPDIKKAVYWYEKAAKKNHEGAQYELGVIYEKGVGVEQDVSKAHHYYQLAAMSGRSYLIEELSNFEKRHNLKGTN